MSDCSKRRGEDLLPPERRRRLNKNGVGEARRNSTVDMGGRPSEPPRALTGVPQELLNKYAADTIAEARMVVAGACLLGDEAKRENKTLQRENLVLRACIEEVFDGMIRLGPSDSPRHIFSLAHAFRKRRKWLDEQLAAVVSEGKAALERERFKRLQAQVEAEAFRAISTSTTSDLEEETARRKAAESEQQCQGDALAAALLDLRRERTARAKVAMQAQEYRNARIAASNAMAGEKGKIETARKRQQHYKDLVTSALQGLKGGGTGGATSLGDPRKYKAFLSFALAGLRRERTAREGQAQALTAAVRTAEHALKEERARREAAEDGARCVICLSHSRNTMLLPCTHLVLCDKCPRVSSCPICRAQVQRTMPVILS